VTSYPWLNEARQEFQQRLENGRLAHAFLLCGPRGLGKLDLAREMVAALLCQKQAQRACGVCRSCRLIVSGAHPDFRSLTFELNFKTDKMRTELIIDQVRELNASMQLTHTVSPRKVALIFPAEAMNRNTSNALLKTLEEPPGDAVLLLVSHDPSRLPATIRSRCQTIHVRLPSTELALRWLVESQGADVVMAGIALRASAGSPVLAQRMLAHECLQQFRAIEASLERIRTDEAAVGELLEQWAGLDQETLWNWLSLISAQRLRDCYGAAEDCAPAGGAMANGSGAMRHARKILRLQSLADQNRRALATPLRKDLLLRDWLIQWADLAGS